MAMRVMGRNPRENEILELINKVGLRHKQRWSVFCSLTWICLAW